MGAIRLSREEGLEHVWRGLPGGCPCGHTKEGQDRRQRSVDVLTGVHSGHMHLRARGSMRSPQRAARIFCEAPVSWENPNRLERSKT